MSSHLILLIDFRHNNGREFKHNILKIFVNRKVLLEFMEYLITNNQGVVEIFNRIVQNFLTSTKDHQKERYNFEEFINNFLIYYSDRKHLTTKVTPFKAMMNVGNKDFIHKILENTINKK